MTDSSAPTVLVAGATGYLGGHVCRALKREGYRVVALARDATRLGDLRDEVDDVFVGSAGDNSTLEGVCDGVDIVFTSIGKHDMKRKPTVWEVDYRANMNLLARAKAASVKQFIFISVINAPEMRATIPGVEARERVVDALKESGLTWTVLRPTGFFNDLAGFFGMIKKSGKGSLIGPGTARSNPIHGEDLANVVASAITDESFHNAARDIGGPKIYTMREVGEAAFNALGVKPKIRLWPAWIVYALYPFIWIVNPTAAGFLKFFTYEMLHDGIGEQHGTHTIEAFFEQLVKEAETETTSS